jgi:HK97 family phage major capsid protein
MQRNLVLPAALRGSVFAAPRNDEQAMFEQINATLGDIRSKHINDFGEVRDQVDNITASLTAMQRQIDGGGFANASPTIVPVDADYTKAFASFIRKGEGEQRLSELQGAGERAAIHAALSVGTETAGGYLAPVEWDRKISQQQVSTSPMRRLARVQTTSVGAFTTLWQSGAPGSGWVGETAARPQTTTPTFDQITFAAGEIYANPAATQRILDDAAIDIGAWLIEQLRIEFNRQEGIAFLSGDGVNKPAGLLTYIVGGANEATHPGGPLTVVESAITVDALIDFMYGLAAPYRQNSTWTMSSLTAALIAKMKDDNGQLIWRESLMVGQPSTLLGRPVEIDEGMPGPEAGNIAIGFGDYNAGYLINDRYSSVRVLRDPYTNKPYVMFYATKRVGGGVLDPFAIRLLRLPA